ncbi:MAG: T9SS type B sorting domain-containing protein [Flavobacterium sp.]|nr:T9SS type B sorting domain-containing protein [Flavobacterium sp.]
MKKVLSLFGILYSCFGFSQVITINDTRTADDLVRNVLVNSPCANVANVTSRTGTFYGSSNGIGYFTNTNTAFPLASGVILSSGSAVNSPGPNTSDLSDGSAAWLGDTNLETTLLAAGISMNSMNATVLEFDFTTYSSYFNFQFLFASEEYGTFQCQSPDAFAFLLTDSVTGITTNLAVVPSTSTPISVGTVRDALYNSSCPSANPSYFGAFNGGSNAAASATNFNGQTVLMNASSTLTPNRLYHIKLVIADNGGTNNDVRFDSALFLGGSSFVFNQDVLGPDLTIANATALCSNDGTNVSYTITSGLDPSLFTFVWKDENGVPIPGETGPNLTINNPGTYLLTYYIATTLCEVATNDIVIEYNSAVSTPNPVDLYKCNNGQPSYTYDLSFNTTVVDPSNAFTISYHNLQTEAQNNTNPLAISQVVASGALPKIIWMRIQDSTGCYVTKSFHLQLTPPPTSTDPGDITRCETASGSNSAAFDLAALSATIMGGQSPSIYTLSYHFSQSDADNDSNPIDSSSPLITGNTTIFIRIENSTEPTCFNTIQSFNLIVKPRPAIDLIPNQYVCVQYTLPPLANGGNYYSGPNQGLPMLPVGTIITTDTTVYIYNETGGTPSCFSQHSFDITIVDVNDITPADMSVCTAAALPAYPLPGTKYYLDAAFTQEVLPGHIINTLGTTTIHVQFTFTDPSCTLIADTFDITISQTPIISTVFSTLFDCTQVSTLPVIVTDVGTGNYYTYDPATDVYTVLSLPITSTTHVYAFAENNGCRSTIFDFMVYINSLGIPNVDLCIPPYTLTASPVGEYRDAPNGGGNIIPPGAITQTTRIYTYIPGATCADDDFFDITFHQPTLTAPLPVTTCDSYLLPVNPEGGRYFRGQNGPGNGLPELFAGIDSITATETIWVYKESTFALTPVCYNEVPWTITINPKPAIDSRGNIIECYSYNLTALTNGNYFDNPYDPNNPSAQIPITDFFIDASDLNAEDDIPNRIKTIYITAVNPNDPFCFSENSFTITFDGIEATNLGPTQTHCNFYDLPTLPANNFYYDAPGGPYGTGNLITLPRQYTSSTAAGSPIYVFTETNNRFTCRDEKAFDIVINYTPVLTPTVQNTIVACDTYTLNPLTIGTYYTGPGKTGSIINAPVTYDINNLPPTVIYAYAETATIPNCTVEEEIRITLNNVTELPDVPATCNSYTLNPSALQPGENYYTNSGGSGLLAPNATITNTQTIFIYRNFGTCVDESDFIVTIIPTPIANSAIILPVCDTYTGNNSTNFDGIYQFDLTQVEVAVLGSQTPASDFIFSYYTNSTDASTGSNPITTPTAYVNSNPTNMSPYFGSVWVRIANTTSTNPCYAITEVRLTVYPLPEPHIGSEYFICEDLSVSPTQVSYTTIDTAISGSNYSFEWTQDGNPYGGNTSSITTNEEGTYTVTITNLTTNCENTVGTKVTKYAPYITIDYSDAFANPSYITVNVLGPGSGNYSYQLDGGLFQDSNVFYNVSPGVHTVNAIDKDEHCSPEPLTATIINYPKYFTPNGDNYHETWNIPDLKKTNPNAPISIFDRFGKFIIQITPSTTGWNGTYNGQPLPATDYWFSVDFNEPKNDSPKTFKAHFSLKR